MRWLAALCAAVALFVMPARADAGPRLGTIDLPDDVDHALRAALEPWGIEIDPIAGPAPAGTGATAIAAAEEIAGAEAVTAVLWFTEDGGGSLWIYDVASGELSVRHVPAVRDAADAAALALSAKTMLETTVVAPPAERFGAVAPEVVAAPVVAPPRHVAVWRVHTQVGVRALGGATEPRLGIAASWWPRAHVGVQLAALTGPGIALSDASVIARFTDTAITAAVRTRLPLGHRLALDGGAGLSAHLTALDGYAPARELPIQVSRVAASLDLDALVAISIGPRTELAIGGTAGIALRRQRYLADGMTVLELPAFELRGLGELRVTLH